MDRDTVIALAKQAEGEEQQHGMWRMHIEDLTRFATLVAEHEREACAKAAEAFGKTLEVDVGDCFAEAIRSKT